MGRCYPHLSLNERRKIANWRYAKTPVSEIADRLCRDPSTIYCEIKRNSVCIDDQPELNGYHALNAQDLYEDRRAIHRKLIRFPEVTLTLICLNQGLKPQLARPKHSVI